MIGTNFDYQTIWGRKTKGQTTRKCDIEVIISIINELYKKLYINKQDE